MRDIHCHILPGVDDGARDLAESLAMLDAARAAGVTSIVCTPHCRSPYFDYDAMWDAYRLLVAHADGFPLTMGFEVNHRKLMELGMEWADYLHFDGTDEFLLELSSGCTEADFADYERTIYQLQGRGYRVIIAHPERYRAIQQNPELAQRLVDQGCALQASADFIAGGRLGREKRPAKRIFQMGLYSYIASDAHRVEHYRMLERACAKFPLPPAPVPTGVVAGGAGVGCAVPGHGADVPAPVHGASSGSAASTSQVGSAAPAQDDPLDHTPRPYGAHFKR